MMLTEACARQFNNGDRSRGTGARMLARIHIKQVGRDGLLAIADGSCGEAYIVGLDFSQLDDGELGVHCDCPRFSGGTCCKHLWATMSKFDLLYESRFDTNRLGFFSIDPSILAIGPSLSPRMSRSKTAGKPRMTTPRVAKTKKTAAQSKAAPSRSSCPKWKSALRQITQAKNGVFSSLDSGLPSEVFQEALVDAQHWFVISVSDPANQSRLEVVSMRSSRKQDRGWSRPVSVELDRSDITSIVCPVERAAMALLLPREESRGYSYSSYYGSRGTRVFSVEPTLLEQTLQSMHATGRLAWKLGDSKQHFQDAQPVREVDLDGRSQLTLCLQSSPGKSTSLDVKAQLKLDSGDSVPIERVIWASDIGAALIQIDGDADEAPGEATDQQSIDQDTTSVSIPTRLLKIAPADAALLRAWQQAGTLSVPRRSLPTVLRELSATQSELPIEIESSLEIDQRTSVPTAKCLLKQHERYTSRFDATLSAVYDGREISFDSPRRWWFDDRANEIVYRDTAEEARWLTTIPADDFQLSRESYQPSLQVLPETFVRLVDTLQSGGWEVIADGAPIRVASDFHIEITSSVDWFDLSADVDFDGVSASLPLLLNALRRGDKTIRLDDGSQGMLPADWLKQFVGIRSSGKEVEGAIRFKRTQALLLDLMLQERDDVSRDRDFVKFVKKLKSFERIVAVDPPKAFSGTMRDYQRIGLGWFQFLREFGFGGCLADDMGLGKTIQVLALLEQRRTRKRPKGQPARPSLVVVPKSLVFNWMDEAAKFTPKLRLLNYTGTDRRDAWEQARAGKLNPHVIVTTYGTLRNDAAILREHDFDYVILDEAQAIKNSKSLSAKATRLLRGDHRLVMTGTPVENHLGDLWSLFDFLNPGMLEHGALGTNVGTAERLPQLGDDENRKRIEQIGRSLRPFILRRTKTQVLTELPDKVEQTLACEMGRPQRNLYDELREHYRLHLSKKVEELGLKRSKIHVLEALLRLRQAACDPRLVKPDCGVRGTKIDNLLEQLAEVIGEGHKALVFSQFTSLLGLLRQDIDARGWGYEYLDGKTRKRSEKVNRFQTDDACHLFLISLKAGGNGLNLTAADYVFILDPWWNPAVEAQAIDRAHRMGQTKSVNAYRMICTDTVEEKIIELQQTKRNLADAIVSQDKSLISDLTADDLQALLG